MRYRPRVPGRGRRAAPRERVGHRGRARWVPPRRSGADLPWSRPCP